MTRKFIITFSLMTATMVSVFAQNATQSAGAAKYKLFSGSDQTEFGVSLGLAGLVGDLQFKPGVGIGVHVRKALDYTFSLRVDASLQVLPSSTPTNNPNFEYRICYQTYRLL